MRCVPNGNLDVFPSHAAKEAWSVKQANPSKCVILRLFTVILDTSDFKLAHLDPGGNVPEARQENGKS
jgi:hypothetical protein